MEKSIPVSKFLEIAKTIEQNSRNQARVTEQEEEKEKRHFLVIQGKRLGQSLEEYARSNPDSGLIRFLAEIVMPLKAKGLRSCFSEACKILEPLGMNYFSGEYLRDWQTFFELPKK
ncbi:MAG: hypothetical protein WC831_02730 [Parcubacteria group bacterium]